MAFSRATGFAWVDASAGTAIAEQPAAWMIAVVLLVVAGRTREFDDVVDPPEW
jgi:hypothetical protein